MDQPVEIVQEVLPQPLTVPVEAYISPDYARAEKEKLWMKVWQVAGRLEDLPNVGDYITYEIADQSILIVRTEPETVQAYYNVCMHRGRRLVDKAPGAKMACGHATQFRCGFHGWRWNTKGENIFVLEKNEWQGALTEENLHLRTVKSGTWGGWVWVNLDPDAEPLMDYLEPAASMLAPYQLENMRYRWRRWLIADCNWKVAMEAFCEIYHL